jgi:hypothetical protein
MKDKDRDDKDKDNEQRPNTKRSRKAYRQPQLQVYGDLRTITQTLGMSGAQDQPTKMKVDKTSA